MKKKEIIEDIILNKRIIFDRLLEDESTDIRYIKKLENIDNAIDNKNNNYIEDKVKDVLINEGKLLLS